MGRIQTISSLGAVHTKISYRVAAMLAKKMRAKGFKVTARFCKGSTPSRIAGKIVPKGDLDAQALLATEIARMCEFIPEGEVKNG
ncbi:MAG: hypothetical protein KA170_03660 [Candidatus Promineofilum sp.]|nr:hypothetical protein [Promineifilum sp.]